MKKSSLIMMFAAATGLASCTAQSPKANMKSDVDTLSYMMGAGEMIPPHSTLIFEVELIEVL